MQHYISSISFPHSTTVTKHKPYDKNKNRLRQQQ